MSFMESLGDPDEPQVVIESPRTCSFMGCDQLATIKVGGAAKSPNRCENHAGYQKKTDSVSAPSPGNAPPRGKPKARSTQLKDRLAGTIGLLGTLVFAVDQFDGTQILSRADQLATALDHLAQQNPSVRKVLESAMTGGAWGEVVLAVAPLVVAIAAHHGLLPEQAGAIAQAIPVTAA